MTEKKPTAHPYIPNSVPAIKAEMLQAVGAQNVDEFYQDIPPKLRLNGRLNLPEPFL